MLNDGGRNVKAVGSQVVVNLTKKMFAYALKKGYTDAMTRERRGIKGPKHESVTAKLVVHAATVREKNPAAVALGRLGGLKGGPARAKRLSAARRKEIAQAAARARWQKGR